MTAPAGRWSPTSIEAAEKLGGLQPIEPVEHDVGTGRPQFVGIAASDRVATQVMPRNAPAATPAGCVLDHGAASWGGVSRRRAASRKIAGSGFPGASQDGNLGVE